MTSKFVLDKIQQAYDTKAEFLDLGNCGLTEIPEEIVMLVPFLKKLSFGSYYDVVYRYTKPINKGKANKFIGLLTSFERLSSFKHLDVLCLYGVCLGPANFVAFEVFRTINTLKIGGNQLTDKEAELISHLGNLSSLDISHNHLTDKGAEAIGRLDKLISLDIQNNELTDKGAAVIGRLGNLSSLYIGDNKLMDKGAEAIGCLGNLSSLCIENNQLTAKGAKAISRLSDLSSLRIGSNDLTAKGTEAISRLSNLSFLDIGLNELTDKGAEAISRLNNLSSLDIGGNQLTDKGAEAISRLSNLSFLNIGMNYLTAKGAGAISRLSDLSSLIIEHNYLTAKGAEAISRLSELSFLRIASSYLTDKGAEAISRLNNLSSLDIGYNRLTDKGAEAVSHLSNLSSLGIGGNELTDKGAEAISRLSNLTSLKIEANYLTAKGAKAISGLSDLSSLDIGFNQLTAKGAEAISRLSDLSSLGIVSNKLTNKGAEAISRLSNLSSLDIGGNQLTDKGAEAISRLSDLSSLDIGFNQLTAKGAEAISCLNNLATLEINDNQLADQGIETIIKKLNLKRAYLINNKVVTIPEEILDNIDALRAYFKSIEKVDNTLVKMILIGNTTAGKSCLAEFLIHKRYSSATESTHGIKLWKWKMEEEGNSLQVNIWDLGGQDYYHATHNIFLDNKTLYLLLHTPQYIHEMKAEKVQYLPPGYWLGNIDSFTNSENTIWYIQSKADLYEPQYLETALAAKYQVEKQFFISVEEASNSGGMDVPDFSYFYKSLCEQLANLARGQLPVSWVTIRDQFLPRWRKKELFYSIDKFRKECFNALQTNIKALWDLEQSWDGLLPYLKGCGEVVYFPKNAALQDMIFLSADKLTNGINELLSKKVKDNNGTFTLHTLQHEDRKHAALYLKVLLAFGLVFEKQDSPGTYVVPQYLPENPQAIHFQQLMSVAYVIHFPEYMSRSLITRFLINYAGHLTDNHYWRYGAFFKLGGTPVLVCIDAEAQKIYVHTQLEEGRNRYQVLKELFFFFALPLQYNNNASLREECALSDKVAVSFATMNDLSARIGDVPGEIELSLDEINFVSVKKLLEAIDNKAYKVKSIQGGDIVLNEVLYQLLCNNTTMPKKIFISYSHKDEGYKDELDKHFAAMNRNGKVVTWHDRKLKAGEDWDASIKKALNEADIMLLLLSPDFMASDYIWNTEIPGAKEKGVTIIPIFLRPCDFKESVFELYKTQGLPSDARWIVNNHQPHRDAAYLEVVDGIKAILDK